jgi:hypothetical protein
MSAPSRQLLQLRNFEVDATRAPPQEQQSPLFDGSLFNGLLRRTLAHRVR